MKKPFKIIMLPSENSDLYKYGKGFDSTLTYKPTFQNVGRTRGSYRSHHLYVLSNERMKSGNWAYNSEGERDGEPSIVRIERELFDREEMRCSKIIATTDVLPTGSTSESKCEKHKVGTNPNKKCTCHILNKLPNIPESFIEDFVRMFNVEQKLIMNVEIEMDDDFAVKVDEDNMINIQIQKKTFSREETIDLITKAWNKGALFGFQDDKSNHYINKFISENL